MIRNECQTEFDKLLGPVLDEKSDQFRRCLVITKNLCSDAKELVNDEPKLWEKFHNLRYFVVSKMPKKANKFIYLEVNKPLKVKTFINRFCSCKKEHFKFYKVEFKKKDWLRFEELIASVFGAKPNTSFWSYGIPYVSQGCRSGLHQKRKPKRKPQEEEKEEEEEVVPAEVAEEEVVPAEEAEENKEEEVAEEETRKEIGGLMKLIHKFF
jgi:hypothetical protein